MDGTYVPLLQTSGKVEAIIEPEIVVKEVKLENKSIEELEKEMEIQKEFKKALIERINEQWYREKWDREKIIGFNKNIDLIYLKIKELKKWYSN